MKECNRYHNNTSRIWSGLIILGIGLVFFLKNIGVAIPDWLIGWNILLIMVGLLVGYKRNFHGGGWLIMVLIGVLWTLKDIWGYDLSKYYFAIAFISLGLFLIIKPKRKHHKLWRHRWKEKFAHHENFSKFEDAKGYEYTDKKDNDVLDSVNVFGGSHQNVYSKNFKGGDVIAIFGGSDINLTQADFEGTITLDVVAIFGGMKIIIPPSWEVKPEITAIFGGLDDKRPISPINAEQPKILIIKGVALFGGVDIRNF